MQSLRLSWHEAESITNHRSEKVRNNDKIMMARVILMEGK